MMDIRKHIGIKIRKARELQGINQEELAKRLRKAKNVISSYETGVRTVKVTDLPALAQALDVSISYFFEELPLGEVRSVNSNQRLIRKLLTWLVNFDRTEEEAIEVHIFSRASGDHTIHQTIFKSQE